MINGTKFYDVPIFSDRPACAGDSNPDDWFPDEMLPIAGIRQAQYSHTIRAERARTICRICPVSFECLNYALQFVDLQGIWANKDRYEREALQKKLGLTVLRQVYISNNTDGVYCV